MKIWISAAIAACVAAGFAVTVQAAGEPGGRGACRADVEKLCKGVEPGKGRIAQCLKDNEAQVSPECKEHMAQMREHMHERMEKFSEACKGDVQQYCKNVQPGQGRIAKCLNQNEASLSQSCKAELAQMREHHEQMMTRMHAVQEACKGDAQQFCKDVKPGGGRVLSCLKQNEAKLSEGCRSALQPK